MYPDMNRYLVIDQCPSSPIIIKKSNSYHITLLPTFQLLDLFQETAIVKRPSSLNVGSNKLLCYDK